MSASTSPTTASHMPTAARFQYLLHHTKALVHFNGPYTTHTNTTVFIRASHPTIQPYGPSSKCMASSLAAAQDCVGSVQVPGPAKEDLHVFMRLWDTTIELLEEVLATGDLDHESFGWGIWGLCAGYVYLPAEASYEMFEEHKHRLHEALLALPKVKPRRRKEGELVMKKEKKVEVLAKTNRQVHICASLVLQRFRQEGWHRIRWWHAIKVVERWVARLGLEDEVDRVDVKVENDESRARKIECESTNGD